MKIELPLLLLPPPTTNSSFSSQRDTSGPALLGVRPTQEGDGFDPLDGNSPAGDLLEQVPGHAAFRQLPGEVGEYAAAQLVRQLRRQSAQSRPRIHPRDHDARRV